MSAILQTWYPGTRGGEAVAPVLFGDVSPVAESGGNRGFWLVIWVNEPSA